MLKKLADLDRWVWNNYFNHPENQKKVLIVGVIVWTIVFAMGWQ